VTVAPWKFCLECLEGELTPQQFNTWIRPLHALEKDNSIRLLAPNRFVMDWVNDQYLSLIKDHLKNHNQFNKMNIYVEVGSQKPVSQHKELSVKKISRRPCHRAGDGLRH
jgi:ATPase involved in DNA replication initiation